MTVQSVTPCRWPTAPTRRNGTAGVRTNRPDRAPRARAAGPAAPAASSASVHTSRRTRRVRRRSHAAKLERIGERRAAEVPPRHRPAAIDRAVRHSVGEVAHVENPRHQLRAAVRAATPTARRPSWSQPGVTLGRSGLPFFQLARTAFQFCDHRLDFFWYFGVGHCQGEFTDPRRLVAQLGGGLRQREPPRRPARERSVPLRWSFVFVRIANCRHRCARYSSNSRVSCEIANSASRSHAFARSRQSAGAVGGAIARHVPSSPGVFRREHDVSSSTASAHDHRRALPHSGPRPVA